MNDHRRTTYLSILQQNPTGATSFAQFASLADEIAPNDVRNDLEELGFVEETIDYASLYNALKTYQHERSGPRPVIEIQPPSVFHAQASLIPTLRYQSPSETDCERLISGYVTPADRWAVREQAEHYTLKGGFEHILALEYAAIDAKEYQLRAVRRVLAEMHGNAILADEVGLGKTVEAGLIIKEYHLREMITSCLILTPAPLVDQWQEEMNDKFGLDFHRLGDSADPTPYPLIVASIDRAKSSYRKLLQQKTWDMVVVDECHILKNHRTGRFKFVFNLKRKHCLLLSATPVQNELRELYNLITLARPGHLKGPRQFQKLFMEDRRHARNVDHLRSLLNEVMIRNRRSNTLTELPPRRISHYTIELTQEEHNFHDAVIRFCKHIYSHYVNGEVILQGMDTKTVVPKMVLVLMILLKEMTSSSHAVYKTLKGAMSERVGALSESDRNELDQLLVQAQNMGIPSKARKLLHLITENEHKIIVYTEFVATLEYLHSFLKDHGIDSVMFHGGLTGKQKRASIERFRDSDAQVLLSTESGGQGLNLQFCHRLVNYDLPWNPMRIEQRIGRIHRYGQERTVEISTLILAGTIEEYVLHVLTGKIDMFQTVIGEIDAILSFMQEQQSLDVRITEMILNAQSFDDIRLRMEQLGEELRKANEQLNSAEEASTHMLDSVLS